jgi:murein DD-endopeptidase MepM/ murein hydrolase activator NlpD
VVFIGKGVFPNKLLAVRDEMLTFMTTNVDFRQTFSRLGTTLGEGGAVLDDLGNFCVEVFGRAEPDGEAREASAQITALPDVLRTELQFLGTEQDSTALTRHYFSDNLLPRTVSTVQTEELPQSSEEPLQAVSEEPPAVPAAGTVVLQSDYSGQALPDNYTMDQLSLGALDTVEPVLGHLNSEYGYREHPINGAYQFHGGVDIGGQSGDPIGAFAAGTVEYIGEDNSYGLYLQIDHGNGVKSFYAHCKTLCVSQGQTVAAGEKVAEVGSTGSATGPHLHFELKYQKLHLNPAYYLEFLPRT